MLLNHSFVKFSCLLLLTTFLGCGEGGEYREVTSEDLVPVEEHSHAHAAPHGGTLVELGNHEYNAELVANEAEKTLKVYVLGPHAETSAAAKSDSVMLIVEGTEIPLTAEPQEGEAEGTASQFSLTSELPEGNTPERLHGSVKLTIGEKEYTAEIPHGDHGDHAGHDH